MALLGPNDLKQFALPANWDAGMLEQMRLASGETYAQLINDIAAGLALANAALVADPLVSSLVSITQEASLEYRAGVSNGFEAHTEYGEPDAKRASTTGHMLPLKSYDRKLGWTWDFLRLARRAQIDADIASAVADLQNLWQQRVLTRLFKETYDAVGSGKSVPLADGGTADTAYIPVNHPDRAAAFAYTHDHIAAADGITQAILEAAVAHLWEHGHDAPFDLLIAQADISSWSNTTNVTGWIKRPDTLIQYGSGVDLAQVGTDYIGVIETSAYGPVRVRASARIPTAFWAAYKSYGNNDQRNPLVVRESATYGTGAVLLAGDHIRQFPLESAILFVEFGVGVNDRVGAVARKNTSGSYADPTIA